MLRKKAYLGIFFLITVNTFTAKAETPSLRSLVTCLNAIQLFNSRDGYRSGNPVISKAPNPHLIMDERVYQTREGSIPRGTYVVTGNNLYHYDFTENSGVIRFYTRERGTSIPSHIEAGLEVESNQLGQPNTVIPFTAFRPYKILLDRGARGPSLRGRSVLGDAASMASVERQVAKSISSIWPVQHSETENDRDNLLNRIALREYSSILERSCKATDTRQIKTAVDVVQNRIGQNLGLMELEPHTTGNLQAEEEEHQ